MRALIIATFRHEELAAAQPLTVVLGDLATAPGVRRLTLAPLSRDAVGQLARGTTADVDELYRTTGGNPFFVTEVLGARSRGVPQTVHELARAWPGPAQCTSSKTRSIGAAGEASRWSTAAATSRPELEAARRCSRGSPSPGAMSSRGPSGEGVGRGSQTPVTT